MGLFPGADSPAKKVSGVTGIGGSRIRNLRCGAKLWILLLAICCCRAELSVKGPRNACLWLKTWVVLIWGSRELPRRELKLRVRITVTAGQGRQCLHSAGSHLRWRLFGAGWAAPNSADRQGTASGIAAAPFCSPALAWAALPASKGLDGDGERTWIIKTPLSHSVRSRLAPARWLRPGSGMAAAWERCSAHSRWRTALEPGMDGPGAGDALSRGGSHLLLSFPGQPPVGPPCPDTSCERRGLPGSASPRGRCRRALARPSFGLRFGICFILFLKA